MIDTDKRPDATERMAEALDYAQVERFSGPLGNCEHGRPTTRDCFRCDAADLVAQGFGHQSDHVRAFAAWMEKQLEGYIGTGIIDRYLAAKGENDG